MCVRSVHIFNFPLAKTQAFRLQLLHHFWFTSSIITYSSSRLILALLHIEVNALTFIWVLDMVRIIDG